MRLGTTVARHAHKLMKKATMALLADQPLLGRTLSANAHRLGLPNLVRFEEALGGVKCSSLRAIANFGLLRQRRAF